MDQKKLKERYKLMEFIGEEIHSQERSFIVSDEFLYSRGYMMCQGVILLSGKYAGLGHFFEYDGDTVLKFLTEMRSKTNKNINFVVVSGNLDDHDLWSYRLQYEGCKKIAEFSDAFEGDSYTDLWKCIAVSHDEVILRTRHIITQNTKEKYIKLV